MDKNDSLNTLVAELFEYVHAEEQNNAYAPHISGIAMNAQRKGFTIFLQTDFPKESVPIKEYKGIAISYEISGKFEALSK